MRLIRKLGLRFRSLFLRAHVDKDLDDELRDYVEREVEREIAAGSSPEAARRTVKRAMLGEQGLKEECRDARGTRWIEDGAKDLRFALRTMRRTPVFTVTVVAALALCIGANTAIFSVVDTVLFRPLPFPQQHRLVSATEGVPAAGFPVMPYSCPDYLFVAANNRSFESAATYKTESYEISEVGQPRHAKGARVNASLFQVLGVDPAAGRTFTKEEDENSKLVAVLNYDLARSLFGTPQSALDRTIHVDRKPYIVIGVMPPSFSFPPRGLQFNGNPAEVFVPVSWAKLDREEMAVGYNFSMIARLRPGISLLQADAELRALLKRVPENYPPMIRNALKGLPNFSLESQVTSFSEEVSGHVRQPLLILLAAVAVVLLIGCADVANLMFSRIVGRQREFALRAALGAGSWRLVRQTLTEGLLLSTAGGVAGFVLSLWVLPLLLHFAPDNLPRLNEVGLNWRVGAFVIVVTLATPLFFCLAPLADLLRSGIAGRLHGAGRAGTQSRRQRMVMSGTVVMQFSLAFVLLTAAGLLVRSFIKASEANPGFRPEHVVSLRISLPDATYAKDAQVTSFYNSLLQTVGAMPGVQQTGAVSALPMGFSDSGIISAEGRTGTERQETIFCAGDALGTLRIPLVRGRFLQPQDAGSKQPIAVVSETLAKRMWPGQDPLGRRIKFGVPENQMPWITVVGIVRDVKDRLASSTPRPMMFTTTPLTGYAKHNDMNILVRTADDPLVMVSAIRHAVRDIDPMLPVENVQTLTQVLDQSLSPERFRTYLLAAFAAVALILAILGIGGLLLYSTAQRTQEFGVRIALGADRRDLLLLVLRQSVRLSATGIAIGLAASVLVTRVLSSFLYDTSQYDIGTFVGVPAILALVTLGASAFPAWKAVHTNPIAALKTE